jgi:hypothetical protein
MQNVAKLRPGRMCSWWWTLDAASDRKSRETHRKHRNFLAFFSLFAAIVELLVARINMTAD